jgi:hypothetical protein
MLQYSQLGLGVGLGVCGMYMMQPQKGNAKIYRSYFEEGKECGYNEARRELRKHATQSAEKTLKYIEKDAILLKNGEQCIPDIYLQEKIKIALLPQWNITLLGDKYVCRCPLRASWTDAWVLTEEDSNKIDEKIENMFIGTKFELNNMEVAKAKKQIKTQLHYIIDVNSTKPNILNTPNN